MATLANTVTELVALEYEALKQEQRERIRTRDGLIYATFASIGAVAVAMTKGTPLILLVLPVAVTVLGWTYLQNDRKISELGTYVKEHLAARLDEFVPGVDAFAWERYHRQRRGLRTRKTGQLLVDLAAFCGSAVAAVAVLWAHTPPAWAWVLSIAELAATAALAHQIITSAR